MDIYRSLVKEESTFFFEEINNVELNKGNVIKINFASLDGEVYLDEDHKVHIQAILLAEVILKDAKDNHEFTYNIDEDVELLLIESEQEDYNYELDAFIFEGNKINLRDVVQVTTLTKISPYLVQDSDGTVREYFK